MSEAELLQNRLELLQSQLDLLRQFLAALEQQQVAAIKPLLDRWDQLPHHLVPNPSLAWTVNQIYTRFASTGMVELLQDEIKDLTRDLAGVARAEMNA